MVQPYQIPCKCGILDLNLACDTFMMRYVIPSCSQCFIFSSTVINQINIQNAVLAYIGFYHVALVLYHIITKNNLSMKLAHCMLWFNKILYTFRTELNQQHWYDMIYDGSELVQNIKHALSKKPNLKVQHSTINQLLVLPLFFARYTCLPHQRLITLINNVLMCYFAITLDRKPFQVALKYLENCWVICRPYLTTQPLPIYQGKS